MSGGYHIESCNIERYAKQPDGSYAIVESWFEAASPIGKLRTVCGHKHGSYEEAAECIPAVTKAYIEKRWPKKAVA